jgi:ELWxxDGT repeat protein
MLGDIFPGVQSGLVGALQAVKVGGILFFVANDGDHGSELWRTDGTPANTSLVIDLLPGANGSNPARLVNLNGTLIFWARSNTGLVDAWRSDGTAAGTVQVLEDRFVGSGFATPESLAVKDDIIVFSQFQHLSRIDALGLNGGLLATFIDGSTQVLGVFGGLVYVTANDGTHGAELWQTDGTRAGTSLVKDINPGAANSYPYGIVSAGGKVFFLADDGVHGRVVWTSDGTEAGTRMVVDTVPGPFEFVAKIYGVGPNCYFTAYEPNVGYRLWISDGTEAGTRRIENPVLDNWDLGVGPGGSILFSSEDQIHGAEIWKSDGTESGTALLKDINPLYLNNRSSYSFMGAVAIPGIGQRIFFAADDGVHGWELWVSDGTTAGTRLVRDIRPGPEDTIYNGTSSVAHAGALYFVASDKAHGSELWRSDGTEAGTSIVADIAPGTDSGVSFTNLVEFQGSVFFVADDGVHGRELWKSDGTEAGTVLAAETASGADTRDPQDLIASGTLLYFNAAATPNYGYTLWRSDGTQPGTFFLRDPVSSGGPYSPFQFNGFGGKVFFKGFDLDHGYEPWVSDGTEAGTQMIRDILPGPVTSLQQPTLAQMMGGSIFFKASDGVHGLELWKSDGTDTGTMLVKDIFPGSFSSGFTGLAPFGGYLYFDAVRAIPYDNEIWRTDGTEQGTVPIAVGLGPNLYPITGVTGGLVFTNEDASLGKELWTSDGTAQGTRLAQDIAAGSADSLPQAFTEVGSRIFFLADNGATGYEPWVVRSAILFRQPARAIQDMRDEVKALGLIQGLEVGLLAKLDTADRALSEGRTSRAVSALRRFSLSVSVMTPRWITAEAGPDLRQFADDTSALLADPALYVTGTASPGRAPRVYTTE